MHLGNPTNPSYCALALSVMFTYTSPAGATELLAGSVHLGMGTGPRTPVSSSLYSSTSAVFHSCDLPLVALLPLSSCH